MSSDLNTILSLANAIVYIYKVVGVFIIIVSTIGNICNCLCFSLIKPLRKHPHILFIIGSSIGSFFFINSTLIPAVLEIYTKINLANRYYVWCKMSTYLVYVSGCFCYMCAGLTAMGQYLITSPRIRFQRLLTRNRVRIILVLTCLMWIFIFLPLPISTQNISSTCVQTNNFVRLYSTYWLILGYYFMPILVILVFFCFTGYNLKRYLINNRSLENSVIRMMLIQMSLLMLSGIPAAGFVIYFIITQYQSRTLLRSYWESFIYILLTLFTFVTNGTSFWIYLLASKTFRKNLKEYFLTWKVFQIQQEYRQRRTVHTT